MDNILVVDDDLNILKLLKMRLEANGYRVVTATEGERAVEIAKEELFDLAIVDLKLTGKDGIEIMDELHKTNPELPVIILTAYGTIENAVEAMKRGAYGYLTKPFKHEEFLLQIERCLEKSRLSKEVSRLKEIVRAKYKFENIVGKSEKMVRVLEKVAHIGPTESNVYIEGESGTGKELIARTIHVVSQRKNGPFVAINCAAIPENLLESELFGYKKGAFTGALSSKKGIFLQAHSGTLFLDEISEMSLPMQAKLLRVLEAGEFYPLGSEEVVKVDVRIIAASNKNLAKLVEQGIFREDLFYRIHVIPIKLPPLRERKEDIPLLARHFLDKYARKMNKKVKGITPSALQKLLLYPWPGNIRELENTIECAVAMATHDYIDDSLVLQAQNTDKTAIKPLKSAKEDFEREYLIQLLNITKGNVSRAAKLAGKYRADLYDMLRKHRLDPADFRTS